MQNEFFLNENVYLLKNYYIYNQNVCFNIILCAFFTIFDIQYLHHIMYSEILCINFCYNYFLIWLTDYILNHMLDHDYKISSNYINLEFQSNYLVCLFYHEIFCLSWVQYKYNIFVKELFCCYYFFFIIIFNLNIYNFYNFC